MNPPEDESPYLDGDWGTEEAHEFDEQPDVFQQIADSHGITREQAKQRVLLTVDSLPGPDDTFRIDEIPPGR